MQKLRLVRLTPLTQQLESAITDQPTQPMPTTQLAPMAILADVIERVVVDESHGTPRYILVSHNKKYMQLSLQAYTILQQVGMGLSFAAIARKMSVTRKTMISAEEVEAAYHAVLEKIKKIDGEPRDQQKSFWFKASLIPASRVVKIASRLTFLFHPLVAFLFLSCFIVLSAYAAEHHMLAHIVTHHLSEYFLAYLLFLLSLIVHEFGHATACLCGDVKPGDIGFTVYLIFPAFYSDVSVSWQLSRWQKVRVDVGGLYLQMCMGTLYLALFLLTGWTVFQLAVVFILGTCTINFNPFAKFDGYWIVSDILGITNLSSQPRNLWNYCYRTIRKQLHTVWPYPFATSVFIGVYGLVRTAFWGFFILTYGLWLWSSLRDYPRLVLSIIDRAQTGYVYLPEAQSFFVQSFFLLLSGILLVRISQPLFWHARKWWQHLCRA